MKYLHIMKPIWIVAKRELDSFFDSLIAYVLLTLFLGFCGFFTWLYNDFNIFMIGQATLSSFFSFSAYWSLLIFIPALTMRMIAEERKTGTIELLLTKSVTDRQVLLGKFLAALLLMCMALAFTLPYVITVANIGNLDIGQVVCGYLGLILMSAAYISIGLYLSSVTSNQIVAFLTTLITCFFFHLVFELLGRSFTGFIGEALSILSLFNHYESIQRGVIDSKDIIYFLSIIFFGLFLAEMSLSKRKVNG
jgi:ABC-2 type transport system permease protein